MDGKYGDYGNYVPRFSFMRRSDRW